MVSLNSFLATESLSTNSSVLFSSSYIEHRRASPNINKEIHLNILEKNPKQAKTRLHFQTRDSWVSYLLSLVPKYQEYLSLMNTFIVCFLFGFWILTFHSWYETVLFTLHNLIKCLFFHWWSPFHILSQNCQISSRLKSLTVTLNSVHICPYICPSHQHTVPYSAPNLRFHFSIVSSTLKGW